MSIGGLVAMTNRLNVNVEELKHPTRFTNNQRELTPSLGMTERFSQVLQCDSQISHTIALVSQCRADREIETARDLPGHSH